MTFDKETLDFAFNFVGTFGVAMILVAYWLLQVEKMSSSGITYSMLNLVGSVFMLISLFRFWNLPSVIIEVFWIGISIYGILKYFKKKKT